MKANVALFSVVCLLGTACLGLAIVFSGCGAMLLTGTAASSTMMEAVNRVDEAREHRKGPIPESEWNNVKLWYRISAAPPTYLPKGFSRSRTRNESTGTWFIDERDGKRLFVPKGGAGGDSGNRADDRGEKRDPMAEAGELLPESRRDVRQWSAVLNRRYFPDSTFRCAASDKPLPSSQASAAARSPL